VWLHLPSECCPSAPGREVSTSEFDSLCRMLEPSVTWRGSCRPSRFWRRVWKRAPWIQRLSGLTCPPSTAEDGVAQWIASWADTPASPSPSPDGGPEPTTLATSGLTSPASSGSASPSGASSRTSPTTSISDTVRFDGIWKRWVSALRKDSTARLRSALRTEGSGSSSLHTMREDGTGDVWPTPDAEATTRFNTGGASREGPRRPAPARAVQMWLTPKATTIGENETPEAWQERAARLKARHGTGPNTGLSLPLQASMWSPPHTRDHHPTSRGERACGQEAQVYLAHQAEFWPTPHSNSTTGPGAEGRDGGLNLQTAVDMWLTPNTPGGGRSVDAETVAAKGQTPDGKRTVGLESQVAHWATPTRLDTMAELEFPPSRPDPATSTDGEPSSPSVRILRPRLNPLFVEHLMGLPLGWTDFAPLGTVSFHWQPRMHSLLSALVSKESDEPQLSLFGD
jgi:hypothetical protein